MGGEPVRSSVRPAAFSLSGTIRAAIVLRVLLAVALHLLFPQEFFAPDQSTYHAVGQAYASYWSGASLYWPVPLGPPAYYYLVGSLYFLFGPFSLVPKLLNALVGGLCVGLVYDLAQRITDDESVAAMSARLCAYFPSLVLWSALNIRDIWIVALILLVCRQALLVQDMPGARALLLLAASVYGLALFRTYIVLAVALPMLLSFVFRNRRNLARNVLLGMLAAAAVIYTDQAAGVGRRLRSVDFAEIQHFRYWGGVGAASDFGEVDISTPGKAVLFLPKGVALFLFAPFPWAVSGLRQIITLPETLYFYALVPVMIRGLRRLIRERLSDSLMILLVAAGLTFAYALGSGNAGSAYRYRAQVLCFYLIFAAAGRPVLKAR